MVDVFTQVQVVFERQEVDTYQLGKGALAAVRRVWEEGGSKNYQIEEQALTAPCLLGEVQAVLAAPALERASAESAESLPVAEVEAGTQVQVKFRGALIEVDDSTDFWAGVIGGQVTAVEEQGLLTGTQVFKLFEDAVQDLDFSETWLAGYLLGLGDALLRGRKTYPPAYTARSKRLNVRSGGRRRS
jgi:hypothetical protein